LKSGALLGQLAVELVRGLQRRLHDGLREQAQLRAAADHPAQSLRVHGVVLGEHPVVRRLAGVEQHGLVVLRQLVVLWHVDEEVQHGAALPPARRVVVLRDLEQPELLVVVGADELRGVERPAARARGRRRRRDLLRTTPSFASTWPPSPPTRNFKPRRSSTVFSALRKKPPIWQPDWPMTRPKQLKRANTSLKILSPPPKCHHECCCAR
jgi:hypothetical protein